MSTDQQPKGNKENRAFIHKEETRRRGPGETRQVGESRTGRTKTRRENLESLEMIMINRLKKRKYQPSHFDLKSESVSNLSELQQLMDLVHVRGFYGILQQPGVIQDKFCPLQLQGQRALSLNCSTAPGQRQLLDPH